MLNNRYWSHKTSLETTDTGGDSTGATTTDTGDTGGRTTDTGATNHCNEEFERSTRRGRITNVNY